MRLPPRYDEGDHDETLDYPNPGTTDQSLEFSLYENGIDSIRHAVEHYVSLDDEMRRFKYAILHLAQGTALILKERLRREHPHFVFVDVLGGKKTVDVKTSLDRLEKIAGLDMSDSRERIMELADLRNQIEHYAVVLTGEDAIRIIGQTIPFLGRFLANELASNLAGELGPLWPAVLSIEDGYKHMIASAKRHIASCDAKSFYCERCGDDTAMAVKQIHPWRGRDHDLIECLVCAEYICAIAECRECGGEAITLPYIAFDDGRKAIDLANILVYCTTCTQRFAVEYASFRSPLFLAEVNRWFRSHTTISLDMLEGLLGIVSNAGPSGRPQYICELIARRVISIEDTFDRNRYDRREGYPPYFGLRGASQFRLQADATNAPST